MRCGIKSAFSMVKLADYQAFICSAILLLGILGYGSLHPLPVLGSKDHSDLEIVESTFGILQKASATSNNTIASQAVQGLSPLAMLVNCGKMGICSVSYGMSVPYVRIMVPGSGVITISPGKLMTKSVPSSTDSILIQPPPTIQLSHSSYHEAPNHQILGLDPSHDTVANTALDFDIFTMNLDWISMITTDLENAWAWLVDENAGSTL